MGEVTLSTVRPVQTANDSGAYSAESGKDCLYETGATDSPGQG